MVDLVNRHIWRAGAQLRGARSIDVRENLVYRYLAPDFFFVQIGANDGRRVDPIREIVTRHQISGLAVEPLPDMFAELRKTYATQPQIKLANVAVHRTEKTIVLHRVKAGADVPDWAHGIASLDPDHHRRLRIDESLMETAEVPALTLAELMSQYGVPRVDLFQVDTEGYDAELVGMLLDSECRPSLIFFEHGMCEGVMSKHTFLGLTERLMDNGYHVITLDQDAAAYRP